MRYHDIVTLIVSDCFTLAYLGVCEICLMANFDVIFLMNYK